MKRKSLLFLLLFALMAPWAANAQTLFSEGFEGGSMPAGWTTDGPGTWSVGSGDYSTSTGAGLGTYNALIKHGNTGDVTKLITPEIDLSSVTSATLSFMHVQRSWAGDFDYLTVYYRTSSSETWTQLVEYTGAVASWTTEEDIILPSTTATYQLAFEHTDNYGYGVGLDQIVISAPSSCPKPAALAVAANGQSATLTWASDASQFAVAHSTDATADPSDNVVTTVSETTYTMNNLAIDTDHYFWVRANCSATEQSAWAGPISVHIGYCVPAPTSVDGNGISNVTFGMGDYIVNNDTPKATFADFTSQIGAVQAGVEASIAITFKTGYTYNTYVWVDLDNSLTFDADEVVCYGESTSTNPTTLTLNFTIPADQTLGDFRLRIGSADSGMASLAQANPCYSSSYACFQDYTLRVLEAPTCLIPTGLALTASGATVTATWNGTADTYNIDINGTVTNNVTSPYTFTGELATTYVVKVQANCGGGNSEWSNPASITTDICLPENQCEITYELADSYGDGWNSNYINVVDVETEAILATLTLSSGNSASGTLALCDGRAIQFQYGLGTGSTYPGENSWVIKDVNGEVIWEYSSPSASMSQNYTVNCTVTNCKTPSDLTVSNITGHGATVTWTENGEATEWVVRIGRDEYTTDQTTYTLTGLDAETDYTVDVRPVCDDADDKWATTSFTTTVSCPAPAATIEPAANSATVTITGEDGTYNMRYRTPRGFNYGFEHAEAWVVDSFDPCTTYDGDQTQCYGFEGETISNIPFTGSTIAFQNNGTNMVAHTGNAFGLMVSAIPSYYPDGVTHSDDWFILPELTIENGYEFSFWGREITTQYGDETINVGIYGSSDGTFASYLEGGEAIAVNSTTWTKYTFDLSEYAGQTIRLAINYVSNDIFGFMFDDIFVGNPEDDTWDYVLEDVTSPYEITGLEVETDYELQVQVVCGEDEVSEWSNTITFTTLPLCEVPTNVAVDDITTYSAVVTWESEATSFDIEVNDRVTEDVTSPYTLNDLDPGTAYTVRVRANCGENGYSAWTTAVDFTTPCLAYDLPYEYGFETADDMSCWSMMAANSANTLGRINITAQGIDGVAAYEGDYGFVFSSYNQADQYDQVLISPELNSGNAEVAFEFNYLVYGSGTEEVYVLYSTATDNLDDFEVADAIEATNTDEWLQYQTTLPAGTKYVALYYYSNYQYYLFVDGFKFEEVAGNVQTVELTEGWNWFSSYIAYDDPVDMLDALKESLGENADQILSANDNTEFDGEEWFGGLDDSGITNEEMVMILANTACTVELEGTPANPADYPITINSGWNWIGFPSAEALDVMEALANFPAEEGDLIVSQEDQTEFDGEEWFGFETFEPGQGLMYYSISDKDEPLVFQTGAKAKRANTVLPTISMNQMNKITKAGFQKTTNVIEPQKTAYKQSRSLKIPTIKCKK